MSGGAGRGPRGVVLVTATAGSGGSQALAAALATCMSTEQRPAILVEVGAAVHRRRPTLLASPAARECEARLGGAETGAAARGLLCHLAAGDGEEGLGLAARAVSDPGSLACVVHVDPELWLAALGHPRIRVGGALIRAALPRDRPVAGLAVRGLRSRGIPVRVATRPLGWAAGRRALAGVRPGGGDEERLRRWSRTLGALRESAGQVLPAVLGGCMVLLVAAMVIVSIAGALTGKGRLQRAADLAALSAARSMRDDMPRVTAPPLLPNGLPNPFHMTRAAYLVRARGAAVEAGRNNDADPRMLRVRFPDAWAFPPLRVRVDLRGELRAPGRGEVAAYAVAEAAPGLSAGSGMPSLASGGGYSGPLMYRQGEPMRSLFSA